MNVKVAIAKCQFLYFELLPFMDRREQLRFQLVCRRFYEAIVPRYLKQCSIRGTIAGRRKWLFSYHGGSLACLELDEVRRAVNDVKEIGQEGKMAIKGDIALPWKVLIRGPKIKTHGPSFVHYLSDQKVMVLNSNKASEFDIEEKEISRVGPCMPEARLEYGSAYRLGERFIFVIGGRHQESTESLQSCLKLDIRSLQWEQFPPL